MNLTKRQFDAAQYALKQVEKDSAIRIDDAKRIYIEAYEKGLEDAASILEDLSPGTSLLSALIRVIGKAKVDKDGNRIERG